jgi:nucleotide-binding universal stress UspA family protein
MVTDTREQYEKDVIAMAERRLGFAKEVAGVAGVACDVVHTVAEHPYAAIIEAGTARGCDLIVMASHGRKGFTGLVLGSETLKVLTHSKIPTLVTR